MLLCQAVWSRPLRCRCHLISPPASTYPIFIDIVLGLRLSCVIDLVRPQREASFLNFLLHVSKSYSFEVMFLMLGFRKVSEGLQGSMNPWIACTVSWAYSCFSFKRTMTFIRCLKRPVISKNQSSHLGLFSVVRLLILQPLSTLESNFNIGMC